MMNETSPERVVQRQLEAYNAKNIEACLATYAVDAKQYEYPDRLIASGQAQIRERLRARFSEPNLRATLIQRQVMGKVVVDHENVSRTFDEGAGEIEVVCIYIVENGAIQSASFIFGAKVLRHLAH